MSNSDTQLQENTHYLGRKDEKKFCFKLETLSENEMRTYADTNTYQLLMVQHRGQKQNLPLNVTKGDGPSLLGWDWLTELQKTTYYCTESPTITAILGVS